MKYEVLKKFYDRYTRELHTIGQVLDIDEEREKEILSVGDLISPIVEEVKEESVQEEPKPKRTRKAKKVAE